MDAEQHGTVGHALVGHPPDGQARAHRSEAGGGSPAVAAIRPRPVGRGARAAVGAFGEQLVADRLVEEGWTVLERNWRSPVRDCPGELDVIATDPDGALVVVEVRTRRGEACGTALESVTPVKLRRLRRLSRVWWAAQPPSSRAGHPGGPRIDVVAVQLRRRGPSRLTHVRGVG